MPWRLLAATLATLALGAAHSSADEVRSPLSVDYEVLRVALARHLSQHGRGGLALWRSAGGCGSFVLREATIGPADGRVRITGPASASAGVSMFGLCWANVSWTGYAEIVARPELGPDWQLRFRDPDVQLYDSTRQRRGIAPRLFTVVRARSTLPPRPPSRGSRV